MNAHVRFTYPVEALERERLARPWHAVPRRPTLRQRIGEVLESRTTAWIVFGAAYAAMLFLVLGGAEFVRAVPPGALGVG
jgi:hypothetical protein